METSNSGANDAIFHTQNGRRGLGRIETINSFHNVAVVSVQNHRCMRAGTNRDLQFWC